MLIGVFLLTFFIPLITYSETPPPPTITSFSPQSGETGAVVIIKGTNFTSTPSNSTDSRVTLGVQFGGTNAASFTIKSSTEISAIVGNGSTGKVTVTAPGGTATSAGIFTYIAPIPTLNEWAMTIFAMILMSAAILILRKRYNWSHRAESNRRHPHYE